MLHVSEAGSLALLTWTDDGADSDAARSSATAYADIANALDQRGLTPIQERVFGDLGPASRVLRGRLEGLGDRRSAWPVPPTYIEGSPLRRSSGLAGIHVIGARGKSRTVADGERVYGALVETETARLLGLSDVGRRASGRLAAGAAEDAGATIEAAEELLGREGFSFRDVARTWFYLRDILDWYGPFNAVRNAAFQRMGLMGRNGSSRIPASTGIEGKNARGGFCALDLLALAPRPGAELGVSRLSSRKQNEATEYGSAFARGMQVTLDGARIVFVSGTASIDDHGATVHVGDFAAQTRFTLEAVRALLKGAGASLADVRQGTAFLKDGRDLPSFERIAAEAGLATAGLITTEADVCRDDLLFEIDATAVVAVGGDAK